MSRSFFKNGKSRELFKFALYLLAPIGCAAIYSNPEIMKQLILKFDYVHYPPAKVMSQEEIKKQMDLNRQMLKEMLAEEAAAAAAVGEKAKQAIDKAK